jgi:PAS domain-containing protein
MFIDECDLSPPDGGWNYEPSRAELLQRISAPLYTTDAKGWLTYYNDAAAELWGRHPVIGEERWCGSWRIYDTDGNLLVREQWPLAIAFQQSRAVHGLQFVLEQPDGTRLPVMPHPTLLRDKSGIVVAGSNILLKTAQPSALHSQFSDPSNTELWV